MDPHRRRLIAGAGAAALTVGAGAAWWRRRSGPDRAISTLDRLFPHPLRLPAEDGIHAIYDAGERFTLISRTVNFPSPPAGRALAMAYEVEHPGRVFINPVLRVPRGARLRVRYWNALDEPSIVHWHGLKVDTNNDGHPHYAVAGGQTYDYHFTIDNRAGLYWYHPHPHHLAARQAYLGLSGLLLVDDAEDRAVSAALDVRFGATDVPLMLQDKRFDHRGELQYAPGAHDTAHGHYGDQVLVNLTPRPHFDAATRYYRLRLLNASNARIYRLAFLHDGAALSFYVIGGDGGLLAHPVTARELYLAPAERADLVLDLRAATPGDRVVMASLPVDFTTGPEADGPAGAGRSRSCEPLDLLQLRVIRKERTPGALPTALSAMEIIATNGWPVRRFTVDFRHGLWRINGATYRMDRTAFTVGRNAREIWEFSAVGAAMPHPIHVHGYQFRLVGRNPASAQALVAAGREDAIAAAERGWKDTALLWPRETLRIALDFSHPFSGDQVYMLQCHNLEHESHGMMINFRVAA